MTKVIVLKPEDVIVNFDWHMQNKDIYGVNSIEDWGTID